MEPKFSIADVAEHRARELGPFRDAADEESSARAFSEEQDSFNRTDRLIHNARVRLTTESKRTAASLKAKFGLSK